MTVIYGHDGTQYLYVRKAEPVVRVRFKGSSPFQHFLRLRKPRNLTFVFFFNNIS